MVKQGATTLVGMAGAGALAPVAGMLAGLAFDVTNKSIHNRVEALFRETLAGEDAEEVAEKLNRALLEEDPQVIRDFIKMGRAAIEAVEPAVIPSIALLFRRILVDGAPRLPRWRLNAHLQVLEEVTAEEFRDLGIFLHGVLRAPEILGEPGRSGVPVTSFASDDGWCAIVTAFIGSPPNDQRKLCSIRYPEQIFQLLVHHRLADEMDSPNEISLSFDLIRPLAETIPRPE